MAYVKATTSFYSDVLLLSDLSLTDTKFESANRGGWSWNSWRFEQDKFIVDYDPLDENPEATVTFSGTMPCGGLRGGIINEITNVTEGKAGVNDNYKISGLFLSGDAIQNSIDTSDTADDIALRECGFSGCDTFELSNYDDRVNGYGGNDVIYAAGGDDTIDGGSGWDRIYAGDGADYVKGGSGGDRINLGWDNDTDTVVYTDTCDSNWWSGRDRIRNFDTGEDKIDLSALSDDLFFAGGHRAANGVWVDECWWTGNTTVYADTNGDACADVSIVLECTTGLTGSDFIL